MSGDTGTIGSKSTLPPRRNLGPSPGKIALDKLLKDKRAVGSALVLIALTLAVCIGPWLLPDFEKQVLDAQLLPPSLSHWMGTDHLGRDVLARVLKGGQLSLAIGLIGTLISVVIGTL